MGNESNSSTVPHNRLNSFQIFLTLTEMFGTVHSI